MDERIKLSIVVPAYQVSQTIGTTLRSVFEPSGDIPDTCRVEVLVVDDGSPDRQGLLDVVKDFPQARLLSHPTNRGMCASRNTGIRASSGDVVTILDADDELVAGWPNVLLQVLNDWPADVNVCFSACRNPSGKSTVSEPTFTGSLSLDDLLHERHAGEYLPLFKGDYIRRRGYVDLNMRRSCGTVSYLTFAKDGPFWVTGRVLRIYHDRRMGSVTSNWTDKSKAREMARCYEALFKQFGELYAAKAPRVYRSMLLRYSVYLRLAGEANAWHVWASSARLSCLPETVGTLLMLVLGSSFTAWAVEGAKRLGLLARYG